MREKERERECQREIWSQFQFDSVKVGGGMVSLEEVFLGARSLTSALSPRTANSHRDPILKVKARSFTRPCYFNERPRSVT